MSYRNQPRGPDGRWIKTGGGLAAVLAAVVALTAAPGGAVAGGIGSDAAGASARSSTGSSGQARATSRETTQVVTRLRRLEKVVDQLNSASDDNCADHATGQVREFFVEHPCTALFRALFELRDHGRPVLRVAVAWVDMPDADQAAQYQQIIDRDGTGTVRPLTPDRRRDDANFDGIAYASSRDGVSVAIAQAEPVGRARQAAAIADTAVGLATSR